MITHEQFMNDCYIGTTEQCNVATKNFNKALKLIEQSESTEGLYFDEAKIALRKELVQIQQLLQHCEEMMFESNSDEDVFDEAIYNWNLDNVVETTQEAKLEAVA